MDDDVPLHSQPKAALRSLLEDAGVRLAENRNEISCIRTKSQRAASTENAVDIIFYDQERVLHNISQSLIQGGEGLMNTVLADIQDVLGNSTMIHLSPTHCVDEDSLRGPQQDSIFSILLRSSVTIGEYICRMLLGIAATHLSKDHSLSNCNSCITRLAVQHMLQVQNLSSSPSEFLEQYMKLVAIIAHDTDMCDFLFVSLIRIFPESDLVLSKFLELWECDAPHTSSILACFSAYANQYKPFHSKLINNLQTNQLPSKCKVDVIAFLFRFCQSDLLLSDVLSHLWYDDSSLLVAINNVLIEPSCNLSRLIIDHFCKLDRIVRPFDIALVSICCRIVDLYPNRLIPMLKTVCFQPSQIINCFTPDDIPTLVRLISAFYSCFQHEFHVELVKSLPLSVAQCLILQSPNRSQIIEHIQMSYQSEFIDKLSVTDALNFFLRSPCLAEEYYQNYRYQLCHPKKCFEPIVSALATLILKKGMVIRDCVQFLSDEHLALLVEVIAFQPNIDQTSPTFLPFVVSEVESAISKSVQNKFVLCAMKLYARSKQKAFIDVICQYKSSFGEKTSLFVLNVTREAFNCVQCPFQRTQILCEIWDIANSLVAKCVIPSIKSDPIVNHLADDKTSRFETQRSTIPGQFVLHSRFFRNSAYIRPLDIKLMYESLTNGFSEEDINTTRTLAQSLGAIMLDLLCDKLHMPMGTLRHLMQPYKFEKILEKLLEMIDTISVTFNPVDSQREENLYSSQDESSFLDKSNLLSIFCSLLTALLSTSFIAENSARDLFIKGTLPILKVETNISGNADGFISNIPMLDEPHTMIQIDTFVPIFECAQRVNISICNILDVILFDTRDIISLKNISPLVFCQLLNMRLKEDDTSNDCIDKILDKISDVCPLETTQSISQTVTNLNHLKSNKILASVFKYVLDYMSRSCSTNGNDFASWVARINWLSRLITIAKKHHQYEDLACHLVRRVSPRLLPNILSYLIPLVESKLIEQPHECLQLLQTLQTCTRFLQHCCVQLRWAGNKRRNLAPLIPKSRRHLELIIYRVQKALRANSMQSAFSCGQLKCRDITGREVNSQMSVIAETNDCDLSTQIYDTDSTDMDVDDVPMDQCSENSASIERQECKMNSDNGEVSMDHDKENVDLNSAHSSKTDITKLN